MATRSPGYPRNGGGSWTVTGEYPVPMSPERVRRNIRATVTDTFSPELARAPKKKRVRAQPAPYPKAAKKKPTGKKKTASKKASAKRRSVAETRTLTVPKAMADYVNSSSYDFSYEQVVGALNAHNRQTEINKRRGVYRKDYQVPEGFQDGYGTRTPGGYRTRPLPPQEPTFDGFRYQLPYNYRRYEFMNEPGSRANFDTSRYYNSRAPKR